MHSMGARKRLQAVDAKIQRHQYIEKTFPDLTDLSTKMLWFTILYQGQLSLREMGQNEAKQTIQYLQRMLNEHPYNFNNCTVKEKLWLTLASIDLCYVCKLRNAIKIGL